MCIHFKNQFIHFTYGADNMSSGWCKYFFLHHGREQTGNGFCDEPLLNITVAGIVFTFAMIGEEMSNLLVYSQKV